MKRGYCYADFLPDPASFRLPDSPRLHLLLALTFGVISLPAFTDVLSKDVISYSTDQMQTLMPGTFGGSSRCGASCMWDMLTCPCLLCFFTCLFECVSMRVVGTCVRDAVEHGGTFDPAAVAGLARPDASRAIIPLDASHDDERRRISVAPAKIHV